MPRTEISRWKRLAMYEQIRRHLTGIDDVRCLIDSNPQEAQEAASQYADDFRLLEDLGWERDDPRESIGLTMPTADLRRALARIQAEADAGVGAFADEEREEREERERIATESLAARDSCRELIDLLDSESSRG